MHKLLFLPCLSASRGNCFTRGEVFTHLLLDIKVVWLISVRTREVKPAQ
jgi:hypothetical protein